MLLKIAKRFYSSSTSQLIKAEVPLDIGKVASQGRTIYE